MNFNEHYLKTAEELGALKQQMTNACLDISEIKVMLEKNQDSQQKKIDLYAKQLTKHRTAIAWLYGVWSVLALIVGAIFKKKAGE